MAGLSAGQSAVSYFEGLSPSFKEDLTGQINLDKFPSASQVNNLPFDVDAVWGVDDGSLNLPGLEGLGALSTSSQLGWTFITAPEDISYDIANNAQRIDIFGTNKPPVVAGSRGMMDLNLGNALVEGFTRNVTVEGKIDALENLMNYGLNSSEGFVSVPVYQVWANNKNYGSPNGGYFIIKDVKVKEAMRDLKGNATRAYVDISLMEVPEFQVNSGRDQASKATAGAKSGLISDEDIRKIQKEQAAEQAKKSGDKTSQKAAETQVDKNVSPKAGEGTPQTDKPNQSGNATPTTGRIRGVSQAPPRE